MRINRIANLLSSIGISCCVSVSCLATGNIDQSFGTNGIARHILPNGGSGLTDFIILSDDRMILGSRGFNGFNDLALARLNSKGRLETSFGSGTGYVTYSHPAVPQLSVEAFAANQHLSTLVAAKGIQTDEGYLYQLDYYGAIDPLFANNGVYASSSHPRLPTTSETEFNAVAVQPDGKVIIVGRHHAINAGAFLLRLDEYGMPDTSFGPQGDGLAFVGPLPFGGNSISSTVPQDLRIADSGHIILAGFTQSGGWGSFVARFNSNGSLDTQFNGNGFQLLTPMAGSIDWAGHVEVDHLGRVYLLSRLTTGGYFDRCLITRFDAGGGFDSQYGNNGQVLLTPPPNEYYNCGSMTLTSEGGLAIAAMSAYPAPNATTNGPSLVFRLDHTGALVSSFGNQGIATIGAPLITNSTYYASLFDNVFVHRQSGGELVFATGEYTLSGIAFTLGNLNDTADRFVLTPNGFKQKDMQPAHTWVYSNMVQIQGLHPEARIVIEISQGEYSVNGQPYTSTPGYVRNGDLINLRNRTGSGLAFVETTTLALGGQRDRKNAGMVRGYRQNYEFTIAIGPLALDPADPDKTPMSLSPMSP